MVAVPDVPAVKVYLVGKLANASDAAIQDALAAETALQAKKCRVDPYDAPLAQALCRRVHRNLAMRGVPLGVQETGDGGGVRLGSTDPEVRRLEGPYRKRAFG